MLRVYLTGEIILESEGICLREPDLPGRQGRLLLARLAFDRRRPASRDELAEVLWPEGPPPSWDVALSALVSKLRAALGRLPGLSRDSVVQAFGCYRLNLPEDAWVDVEEAAADLHLAESALRLGHVREAYPHVVVANAIMLRPFLAGEGGDWASRCRDELTALRVRVLDCMVECLDANGESALAIQEAEEAIRLDPYREAAHRRLIRLFAGAGDRGRALLAYERCRRLLAEELGVSPSGETEEVHRALIR